MVINDYVSNVKSFKHHMHCGRDMKWKKKSAKFHFFQTQRAGCFSTTSLPLLLLQMLLGFLQDPSKLPIFSQTCDLVVHIRCQCQAGKIEICKYFLSGIFQLRMLTVIVSFKGNVLTTTNVFVA